MMGRHLRQRLLCMNAEKSRNSRNGLARYSTVVQGEKPYRVSVESRRFDDAHAECYLGRDRTLCKNGLGIRHRYPLTGNHHKRIPGSENGG